MPNAPKKKPPQYSGSKRPSANPPIISKRGAQQTFSTDRATQTGKAPKKDGRSTAVLPQDDMSRT